MVEIRKASPLEIPLIKEIADHTWRQTYSSFIDPAQIEYMYGLFYTQQSISSQIASGDQFLIAFFNNMAMGFCSFQVKENHINIPKLYIHPDAQNWGVGSALLMKIRETSLEYNIREIRLNVNRFNPAFHFYRKKGFRIHQMMNIPLGDFVLEDYIMTLSF